MFASCKSKIMRSSKISLLYTPDLFRSSNVPFSIIISVHHGMRLILAQSFPTKVVKLISNSNFFQTAFLL